MRVPSSVQFTSTAKIQPRPPRDGGEAPQRAKTVPKEVAKAQNAAAAAAIRVTKERPTIPRPKPEDGQEAGAKPRKKRKAPPQWIPRQPRTWDDLGIDPVMAMHLVMRFMLGKQGVSGKQISKETMLTLSLIKEVMNHLKQEKLVNHRSTTALGDFISELSETGYEKTMDTRKITTYVGPCPVPWEQYLISVENQSLSAFNPGEAELRAAFHDLQISEDLLDRLGPAVTSTKPLFLFGYPGNGKTSLAERMTRCFGDTIWVPRTLSIGGHLVKFFDPAIHVEVDNDPAVLAQARVDGRWVQIKRPTVVAGGELTLEQLEVQIDQESKVHEAPLHLKANCGTMVVDDFGRGKTDPKELLNRWIFPLEKQIDFLRLPDGRKFACPFECMLVFSTNLEPKDLADEAFLRRIPYKVHVGDPDEVEFADLVELLAKKMGVTLTRGSVKYLIERHYKMAKRPMRFCHPRDLLLQVCHLCEYQGREFKAGPPEWDRVTSNYFGLA